MSNQHLQEIFEAGLIHHHLTNTAYPPTRRLFADFRQELNYENVSKAWSDVDRLSLYVHIPFCESRCKFCDYTVIPGVGENEKEAYVQTLLSEIKMYKALLGNKSIIGFDIGGGTPTTLTSSQLKLIVNKVLFSFNLEGDAMPSIETTPNLAASDPEKLEQLCNFGFSRLSMGIQSIDPIILKKLRGEGNDEFKILKAVENIHNAGFQKFNLDLMYGFKDQKIENWLATLEFTASLDPTSITLYRMYYKGTAIEHHKHEVTLEQVNTLYEVAFEFLKKKGYLGNYGQNTVSKEPDDTGLSSYIKERSLHGMPYLGFGLGAQSMFSHGIAYNLGKANKILIDYLNRIATEQFPTQDLYFLPPEELVAKSIAISFYSGCIDTKALSNRFSMDIREHFKQEIEFLTSNDLMQFHGDVLRVTKQGFEKVNGIIPLFYSQRAQKYLLQLDKNV